MPPSPPHAPEVVAARDESNVAVPIPGPRGFKSLGVFFLGTAQTTFTNQAATQYDALTFQLRRRLQGGQDYRWQGDRRQDSDRDSGWCTAAFSQRGDAGSGASGTASSLGKSAYRTVFAPRRCMTAVPTWRRFHTILRTSACHRAERVGVAGQEPAAVGLFAVYGDPMTGQLRCFSAGAWCHR